MSTEVRKGRSYLNGKYRSILPYSGCELVRRRTEEDVAKGSERFDYAGMGEQDVVEAMSPYRVIPSALVV